MVFPCMLAITIGYWLTNTFFADLQPTYVDYIDHLSIGLILVIDFYFGAQPYYFIHFIYTSFFPNSWIVFSVIHYLLSLGPAKENGQHYIYDFVNWNKIPQSVVVVVLIFIWTFVVHAAIWIVGRKRDVPYKHYDSTLTF